jgi:hypothetical protein
MLPRLFRLEIKHFLQGRRFTAFRKGTIPPTASEIMLKNLRLSSQSCADGQKLHLSILTVVSIAIVVIFIVK